MERTNQLKILIVSEIKKVSLIQSAKNTRHEKVKKGAIFIQNIVYIDYNIYIYIYEGKIF